MKLSIITINYNNLAGLKKTADSVINQTWRDFEWIIVDGGSTDGSKEYIEQLAHGLAQGLLPNTQTPSPWRVAHFSNPSYTAQDPTTNHPVILSSNNPSSLIPNPSSLISNPSSLIPNRGSQSLLWCSEPDKGIYNAMNKGIAKASGEYLNFMNSGDVFSSPTILAKADSYCWTADIVMGDMFMTTPYSKYCDHHQAPDYLSIQRLLKFSLFHQSAFIKRALFDDSLYDESYKIISDWIFWFDRLILKSVSYQHICVPICIFDNEGLSCCNNELVLAERRRYLSQFFNWEVFERFEIDLDWKGEIEYKQISRSERMVLHKCIQLVDLFYQKILFPVIKKTNNLRYFKRLS